LKRDTEEEWKVRWKGDGEGGGRVFEEGKGRRERIQETTTLMGFNDTNCPTCH
jgi:hypothetical protein